MMNQVYRHLSNADKILKREIRSRGELPLIKTGTGFTVLAHSIINQQLSIAAAATIRKRLESSLTGGKLTARSVNEIPEKKMLLSGLSRAKVSYLKSLAESFTTKKISTRSLTRLDDEEALQALCQLSGVGRWTAEMFLMFKLQRLDIFPIGDAGLRRAIMIAYELNADTDVEQFMEIGRGWKPYRSVGSRLMWRFLNNSRLKNRI